MSSANLNNLSIRELKKLVKDKNEGVKKLEKEKLILAYEKLQDKEEKLLQEKKEIKSKSKSKPKQEIKTFDEYFQERIKNKSIPKDTPVYLKKALKRVIKQYEKGIVLEKSALSNFSEKYIIEGKPGLLPKYFFGEKASQIKDFLRKYKNTNVRLILVCEMQNDDKEVFAYFHSKTKINYVGANVKTLLDDMIGEIFYNLFSYQDNGSGWYFKEVKRLEIHINKHLPLDGKSIFHFQKILREKKR